MVKKIMKYNPAFLTDQELIDSFAVRHVELEGIVETIRENTGNANQHILLIGPRGIGKTMLALRAAAEVRRDEELSACWYPIVYGEESYQVCSAGEFWLEAIFHLAEQTKEERWQTTYRELKEEKEEKRLRERALGQLLDFAREEKKRILLVVENLNMIFDEQVKEEDGWALRQVLQNQDEIMLLGTATRRFEEVDGIDRAMFDLFKDQLLRPLDENECKKLWKMMTGKRTTKRKIRPIQILTGGNPRLLAIIINFAIHTSFRDLMNDLIQLIDEHTEYFKSHLDGFAATERKVFVALMDLWDPSNARQVAEAARMEVSKASALLNRLVDRGVVMVIGTKGRKKSYQVTERLYNIYHLMRRRGTQSSHVEIIVKFMIMFYEPEELVKVIKSIMQETSELGIDERKTIVSFVESIFRKVSNELQGKIIDTIPREFAELQEASSDIRRLQLEVINKQFSKYVEDIGNLGPEDARKAKEVFESALRIAPESVNAWIALGRLCHEQLENDEKSEKAFREAIRIAPDDIWVWFFWGYFLLDSGRYVEAEEACQRALKIKPDDENIWLHLGSIYEKEGKYAEAEKIYKKVINQNPKQAFACGMLGDLYSDELARYEEARDMYFEALKYAPTEDFGWVKLSVLLSEKLNKPQEAEEVLKKGLEANKTNATLWCVLGEHIGKYSDRFKEAKIAYKKAIEIEANNIPAWGNYITLIADKLHEELKPDIVNECLNKTDRAPGILNHIAWIAYENEIASYEDQMETWAREAVEKDPNELNYKHTLATILGKKNKWEAALDLSKEFTGNNKYINDQSRHVVDFYIEATGAGYGKDALELLRETSAEAVLEPLVVGIERYLGLDTRRRAQEIEEIAKDVKQRIEGRKKEYVKKKKEGAVKGDGGT